MNGEPTMKTHTLILATLATLSLINTGVASAAPGDALRRLQQQAAITRRYGDSRFFYEDDYTPVKVTALPITASAIERLQAQANQTRKNGGESLIDTETPQPILVASIISDSPSNDVEPAGRSLQRLVEQGRINRNGRN
jgi:hypothetical protein